MTLVDFLNFYCNIISLKCLLVLKAKSYNKANRNSGKEYKMRESTCLDETTNISDLL